MFLETLIIIVVAFSIAALPLYFSVKLLGGKTDLFKTILVNLIVGAVVASIYLLFPFAGLLAFIATIILYREFFRLKWWKAILAWFMQGFIAFILVLVFGAVVGFSLLV